MTKIFTHKWGGQKKKWIHAFPKGIKAKMKCKLPYSGFELTLFIPFPTTITITLSVTLFAGTYILGKKMRMIKFGECCIT